MIVDRRAAAHTNRDTFSEQFLSGAVSEHSVSLLLSNSAAYYISIDCHITYPTRNWLHSPNCHPRSLLLMLCNCKSGRELDTLSIASHPRGHVTLTLVRNALSSKLQVSSIFIASNVAHASQDYEAVSQEQSNEKEENRTRAAVHRSLSVCSICLRSRCTPDPCRVQCPVPPSNDASFYTPRRPKDG